MQGFIARTIPIVLRRLVTMTPALIVLAIGLNPSRSLVISQVVLSFGIPFALVPLVLLTRRKDIMGALVNRRLTTVVASVVAALIIALNVFLLVDTLARLAPAAADPHAARPRPRAPSPAPGGLTVVVAGAMAVVAHHVGEAVRAAATAPGSRAPSGLGEQPAQVDAAWRRAAGASDRRLHVGGDVAGGRAPRRDRHPGDASGLLEGDERLRRRRGRRGRSATMRREGQERLHAR